MNSEKKTGSLWIYFLLAILLVLCASILKQIFDKYIYDKQNTSAAGLRTLSVIIDPGHGGKDGGAVSVTGMPEKELNLRTSLMLEAIFKTQGYNVIMTRSTDTELTVEGSGASRKMQDLQGRYNIAKKNNGAVFISIHMNKFPQAKYSGLQVYYSKNNPQSKIIADSVQKLVSETLQKDNDREIKPAGSSIFLLDKITSPAVLIECGFISNGEEAALLEDTLYRQKLCLTVYAACAGNLREKNTQ